MFHKSWNKDQTRIPIQHSTTRILWKVSDVIFCSNSSRTSCMGSWESCFMQKNQGTRTFGSPFFLGGGIPINSYHLTPSENERMRPWKGKKSFLRKVHHWNHQFSGGYVSFQAEVAEFDLSHIYGKKFSQCETINLHRCCYLTVNGVVRKFPWTHPPGTVAPSWICFLENVRQDVIHIIQQKCMGRICFELNGSHGEKGHKVLLSSKKNEGENTSTIEFPLLTPKFWLNFLVNSVFGFMTFFLWYFRNINWPIYDITATSQHHFLQNNTWGSKAMYQTQTTEKKKKKQLMLGCARKL